MTKVSREVGWSRESDGGLWERGGRGYGKEGNVTGWERLRTERRLTRVT